MLAGMAPDAAAAMLASMAPDAAAALLAGMAPDAAGAILAAVVTNDNEVKADKAEMIKADKVEVKADNNEVKSDDNEVKADKAEIKADANEVAAVTTVKISSGERAVKAVKADTQAGVKQRTTAIWQQLQSELEEWPTVAVLLPLAIACC